MSKELQQFVNQRKMLFWSVRDPTVLSVESVTETILNYGDWQDFRELVLTVGLKELAVIFRERTADSKKRTNYRPEIKNYFTLYFDKYAP